MGKNVVDKIDNMVPINTMLVSVSDKTGLDVLIPGMLKINPRLLILSTGGTFNKIQAILGDEAEGHLMQVSDYTGQPETQGGLVKTLDFKIYLGLLTETYNPAHQDDLERTKAKSIDMVICNLYPFSETIAKEGVSVEEARSNIDIGGPTMIRAAAKNFIRVASVVNPETYPAILEKLTIFGGFLPQNDRYALAIAAFTHTAEYDMTIADYLGKKEIADVEACYNKGE